MSTDAQLDLLQKALARERERRRRAEQILESKSRELYDASEALRAALEDLKKNQKQLVQSEKMASLGVMSAGIAHEINNPISFVLSNVNTLADYIQVFYAGYEMIRQELETQSTVAQIAEAFNGYREREDIEYLIGDTSSLLTETRDGLERVREIIQGLRDFARADEANMQQMDLNEAVETALTMAQNQLKYKCEVERKLTPMPPVLGNSGQLSQVVLNLLVNASQATCEDCQIEISTYTKDGFATLDVKDNGCGIPAEDLPKLFTPFFTTKPVGKGTGLGLSISHGIVTDHGGEIQVQSLVDIGTRFTVRIPHVH